MSNISKNFLVLLVWLIGFGSLLAYLYMNFVLAYIAVTFVTISTMVKPPPDFGRKWGLWFGIVIPVFGMIGYAVAVAST